MEEINSKNNISIPEINLKNANEVKKINNYLKNKFSHITFDKENHKYFNQKGEEYRSVSSVLEQFITPFDTNNISERMAKKIKKPANEIKANWAIRRDFSIVRGTEFHLYAETFLSHGRKIETVTPIQEEIDSFHLFWNKRNQAKYDVITTELILADDENKLAGTLDCIVQHRDTKNFFIFDWKTNRNIRKKSKYNSKMKHPISHLDECELNKYSLQLHLYANILRNTTSISIKKCYLIHLCPEKYRGVKKFYEIYETIDMSDEIKQILKEIK